MTRVLLINPQMPFNEINNPTYSYPWIKLGIAYLSSSLKAAGHEVELVDFRYISGFQDLITKLNTFKPEVVSISSNTEDAEISIRTAKIIRKHEPRITICIGGIHASIKPEQFAEAGVFDYIIKGEGEITLPKILAAFPYSIEGAVLWGVFNRDIGMTHVSRIVQGQPPDLNTLPFPDRELWHNYSSLMWMPTYLQIKPQWAQVIVNRGCGFGCRYCCGPGEQNHFKPIRGRSVENVISELHHLQDTYHINSVQYLDDQFIMNPEWVWKFCYTLEDHGLDNIQYWAASRADVILRNKDLVLRMRDTGLEIMSVGFESFSDHLLKFWNKGVTAEQNMEAAMFLKEHDIKIFSNTILGSPREDGKWYIEDDMATVEAIEKIKPAMASRTIFNPIIGSELYQWCHEKGLVDVDSGVHNKPINGVNLRKVRMMMDRIWCDRPWHHRMYDKVMDMVGLP